MLELITGVTLASAAGLNAYIPLLGIALLSRFTDIVALPAGWLWLENNWSLGILAVLLAVEMLVDKIPALDSVNDVLQSVVRPASGGMVFAAGTSSSTVAVEDPSTLFTSAEIWPFLLGIGFALIPHLLKAIARPVLNVLTAGAGAAVSSFFEDLGAALLTILAVIVPVVALALMVGVIVILVRRLRRALATRRANRAQSPALPCP